MGVLLSMLGFLRSPLGKYIGGAVLIVALIGGIYTKGRMDGRASYKAKIEREINDAKQKGDAARERALRDFDAAPDDSLPDDGFRRP